MKKKIYILSLGCPRNLVDSEVLAGLLKSTGYELSEDPLSSDYLIVNTCGFIKSAKEESIEAILKAASIKTSGPSNKKLIVTGCLSQRYGKQLKKMMPEIDAVFGTSDFIKIPEYIGSNAENKFYKCVTKPSFLYNEKNKRQFLTPEHYAYIKLEEGCCNNCSYCIIPKLRGKYRSRSAESVLQEAKLMVEKNDVKEINLIGQDITLFGIDKYGKRKLGLLLRKLSPIMKNRWIRLLYTHPAHYDDDLIDVIAKEEAICKYLDIPVQHISDKILKKMNRRITKEKTLRLIEKLRKKIPGIVLRTTIMVGFPGETEKDFKELLKFVKDTRFERLGVFVYSREEGTPSYNFKGRLSQKIKEGRYDEVLIAQQEISREINKEFLGKRFKVLIDEKDNVRHNQFLGRTYMDAPEVDGTCYISSNRELKPGEFREVEIVDTLEYDLVGKAL